MAAIRAQQPWPQRSTQWKTSFPVASHRDGDDDPQLVEHDRHRDHTVGMADGQIEEPRQLEDVAWYSEYAAEYRERSAYHPRRRSRAERAGSKPRVQAPVARRRGIGSARTGKGRRGCLPSCEARIAAP